MRREKQTRPWSERLVARAAELLIVALLVFLGVRITGAVATGRDAAAIEVEIRRTVAAIHQAQARSVAGHGRFASLAELCAEAPADSPLAELRRVPAEAEVDLFAASGYLFALYRIDAAGDSARRVWTSNADGPGAGYGAFAWPEEVSARTQWAYFVSNRGKLLGSPNLHAEMNGTAPPFPPAANPLRDHLRSRKEGEDGSWFLFEDLAEITQAAADESAGS
jgi:hypothetical protein